MLVKATKKMAKELSKHLPNGYSIQTEKMTPQKFRWYVDIDDYKHENDFDIATGLFNVIKVVYPYEFYAMPKYITTKDLHEIYKTCNKTWDGFVQNFLDEITA